MGQLYDQEWSIEEVAQKMGCTRETIRYHLLQSGKKLRGTGMRTKRSRAKWSGPKHGMWRGGRAKNHGYIKVLRPNHPYADSYGYISEHRLVIETHLIRKHPEHQALDGGRLRRDWVVHHKNGQKDDNRLSNLEALPRGAHHSWLHYHEDAQRLRDEVSRLRALAALHGIEC